jgi:hypothetical protein
MAQVHDYKYWIVGPRRDVEIHAGLRHVSNAMLGLDFQGSAPPGLMANRLGMNCMSWNAK